MYEMRYINKAALPCLAFKNTTSNLKKHLESQPGTEKLKEKVPPGGAGAKQSYN